MFIMLTDLGGDAEGVVEADLHFDKSLGGQQSIIGINPTRCPHCTLNSAVQHISLVSAHPSTSLQLAAPEVGLEVVPGSSPQVTLTPGAQLMWPLVAVGGIEMYMDKATVTRYQPPHHSALCRDLVSSHCILTSSWVCAAQHPPGFV